MDDSQIPNLPAPAYAGRQAGTKFQAPNASLSDQSVAATQHAAGGQAQSSGLTDQDINQTQDQTDQAQVKGGVSGGKEVEPVAASETPLEVVEVEDHGEVPEDVASWVEKVERGEDVHLAKPVTHQGQTLVKPARPSQVKISLPLTKAGVEQGLHVKLIHSLRWLAEWCVRLVKKLPGKVGYKESE